MSTPSTHEINPQTLRLEQMKRRDIPWHLRAASTLGRNAWNLNDEIHRAFQKGAIPDHEHNRIRRRCETDAIEFGSYISLRWLLELCGIKFYPADRGKDPIENQRLKTSDDKNYMLSDYPGEYAITETKLGDLQVRFSLNFRQEYADLCQFSAHPTRDFNKVALSPESITKLLNFLCTYLKETIYQNEETEFEKLVFSLAATDREADTPPHPDSVKASPEQTP